jgi:hypothetical protein
MEEDELPESANINWGQFDHVQNGLFATSLRLMYSITSFPWFTEVDWYGSGCDGSLGGASSTVEVGLRERPDGIGTRFVDMSLSSRVCSS